MDRTAFQLAEENELRSLRRSREKLHADQTTSHFSLSDEIELLSSGLRSERRQAPGDLQDQQHQTVDHNTNDGGFKSGPLFSNNPVFDFEEIGDGDAAVDPLSLLLPDNTTHIHQQDKSTDDAIGPVEQNEGKAVQEGDDNFFTTTKNDQFAPILTPPSPFPRVSHTNAHPVLNDESIQENEVLPLASPNDVLPAPPDADNVSSLLEKVTAQPPQQYQTPPAPYGVANISDAMVLQVVRQALALTVPRIDPVAQYQQSYEEALAKPVETPKDARARRLAILQYKRVTKKPRVVSRSKQSSFTENKKSGTRGLGAKRKLTEQEIEEKRIKNRASVQACRQRKKARKTELEAECSHYGVENTAMRKSFENTVEEIESLGIRLPDGIKALLGDASQDLNCPIPPST